MLYSVLRVCEAAVEAACRARLVAAQVSHTSAGWQISSAPAQEILLILAAVCLAISVAGGIAEAVRGRGKLK